LSDRLTVTAPSILSVTWWEVVEIDVSWRSAHPSTGMQSQQVCPAIASWKSNSMKKKSENQLIIKIKMHCKPRSRF